MPADNSDKSQRLMASASYGADCGTLSSHRKFASLLGSQRGIYCRHNKICSSGSLSWIHNAHYVIALWRTTTTLRWNARKRKIFDVLCGSIGQFLARRCSGRQGLIGSCCCLTYALVSKGDLIILKLWRAWSLHNNATHNSGSVQLPSLNRSSSC